MMSHGSSSSAFQNDQSVSSSSQQPAGLSRFFSQSHNPSQTLEDAFSRLCVSASPFNYSHSASPFNYPHSDFVAESPYGINGSSKIHPYNSWAGGIPTSQTANLWHPTFTFNNYSCHADGCLDSKPLTRQIENPTFSGVYPVVPFSSNGMKSQKTSDNGFLNGGILGGNGFNILGFSFDERRLQWFNNFRGCVLTLATDQLMCRTLQETLKTLTREEFDIIFLELINHVTDLMVDPFGNYVVQRMMELCSEEQRTQIVLRVTQCNFQLVRICLSPHGTRAVEKLLEYITSQEQRNRIMSALSPGAAVLAKDVSGHRVILHCLKQFPREDNENLLNVVANKCFDIATDKTGCCVLQPCINHAQGEMKKKLIASVMFYASHLAEDCYGNYVVQHLLSLGIPGVAESLWRQLEGRFFYLACNKYGSNVVEKFFQDSVEPHSTYISLELLHNPNVAMLLVDPYGNYVIKSALSASRGHVRNALEQLIKQNSLMMQSNLFGKKLLAWFNKGRI
ncbi:pumilio homolog 12-like [Vigna umbellata]|uniref:pumilio homolog 12-like n=1 Tax=Vigna umbellata TaxID=87088 RepID=UPI001F5E7CDE|nr:pumilio homolog 12-like [Vigna umbellata]